MVMTATPSCRSKRRCSKVSSSSSWSWSCSCGWSLMAPPRWRWAGGREPRSLVRVAAFARLAAELAGAHHLLQQRRGAELGVAELLVQRLAGREADVEAHQVGEGQRPDRHVG